MREGDMIKKDGQGAGKRTRKIDDGIWGTRA
jgi:hypothetical protein